VIIFLVPTIINILLGLIETVTGMAFDYTECNYNIKNIELLKEQEELVERLKYERESSENYQKYQQAISDLNSKVQRNNNTAPTNSEAIVLGQKYNLTDDEVKKLCGVAKAEQGTVNGAKAEASLIANRYELEQIKGRYVGKGLVSYVRNSGWFADASEHMSRECPSDFLQAVRDVLVNGNRTLPLYVDEHDYWEDISKIVTNGQKLSGSSAIKNHANYIKDSTVIYNRMSAVYTFYVFPNPEKDTSDPFGYTEKAKNLIGGLNK